MNLFIKILFVVGWVFFLVWLTWGVTKYGWDWVMPVWYKLPLLLGFYGPPITWCIIELIKTRKY